MQPLAHTAAVTATSEATWPPRSLPPLYTRAGHSLSTGLHGTFRGPCGKAGAGTQWLPLAYLGSCLGLHWVALHGLYCLGLYLAMAWLTLLCPMDGLQVPGRKERGGRPAEQNGWVGWIWLAGLVFDPYVIEDKTPNDFVSSQDKSWKVFNLDRNPPLTASSFLLPLYHNLFSTCTSRNNIFKPWKPLGCVVSGELHCYVSSSFSRIKESTVEFQSPRLVWIYKTPWRSLHLETNNMPTWLLQKHICR